MTFNDTTPATSEETFVGHDGMRLFSRVWTAEAPRAILVIVHGFKAHSGQYAWVGDALARRRIGVYAMDLRGHGRSDGERFWVQTFDDYVADLEIYVDAARARHPGLPVFLLGHSAGGVISALYALEHVDALAGLVSESFAFALPIPGFVRLVVKALDKLAPHVGVLKLMDADFSRDPAAVAAMGMDPLINHEPGPAHTAAELLRADKRLQDRLEELRVPLLILHGTADQATRPEGSKTLRDRAGSADKTLKLYDGTFHDPLHDVGKEHVLSDVLSWITERLPPA